MQIFLLRNSEDCFDSDLYNETMGPERGESRPVPESDSKNRYDLIADGLPLGGARPDFLTVDQDGEVYLSMRATSEVFSLSIQRLYDLHSAGRLVIKKNAGRENYVSVSSIANYLDHGRKKGGRPLKNPQE